MNAGRSPYQEAIRLLGRRPHTVEELRSKLLRKGWTATAVDPALSRLQEQGYLNDTEFAVSWIEQRHRIRRYGPERLRRELLLRGVAAETVDQALREVFGATDLLQEAVEAGRRALAKWVTLDGPTKRRRLYFHLLRLGYSTELSRKAVESCLTEF